MNDEKITPTLNPIFQTNERAGLAAKSPPKTRNAERVEILPDNLQNTNNKPKAPAMTSQIRSSKQMLELVEHASPVLFGRLQGGTELCGLYRRPYNERGHQPSTDPWI